MDRVLARRTGTTFGDTWRGLETSAGGKFIFFAMPDNGQPHTWGSLVASQWWKKKELVTQ